MKNKIWLITLGVAILSLIFIFDIFTSKEKDADKRVATAPQIDKNNFSGWLKEYDENISKAQQWGFAPKVKTKPTVEEKKEKITLVTYTKDQNLICIEKSCYRLLAIKNIESEFEAVFYNKDIKNKIAQFKRGDRVEKSIYIDEISSSNVLLEDNETQREWKFTMFDVNTTKYKPKELEDE